MTSSIKVALVAGGMYDQLNARIPEFERTTGVKVSVEFTGTHPEMNAHLASLERVPYHLVTTHTKYAPSQMRFLAPIENFDTSDFFQTVLALAEIDGVLYGIPRNIDLRLLHYRTDLMQEPPATWQELLEVAERTKNPPSSYGFVFPGMESGLFGTFFELAESAGARIFPPSLIPDINNERGRWALELLRRLYLCGIAPAQVSEWHYDRVHEFFRAGRTAMVCDWPGYYKSYCEPDSWVRDRFDLARMPAGPIGRRCCYAGSHTFALTRRGAGSAAAHELLRFLTAPEQQKIEAQLGSVPVRRSVLLHQQRTATPQEKRRLMLLGESIENDLIIPPKISFYPKIEDVLWRNVRAAMTGKIAVTDALLEIEQKIQELLGHAA